VERHDQNGSRSDRRAAERDLLRDLEAVESAVSRALRAVDEDEEDDALMQLESLTGHLLADVERATATPSEEEGVDLRQLASKALDCALVEGEKPLVLQCSWNRGIRIAPAEAEPLGSLIQRLLGLVARFATIGDMVRVRSAREGDERALVEIGIVPAFASAAAHRAHAEFLFRAECLDDFASEFGAHYELLPAASDGTVTMRLDLPALTAQV
jgi:hypothetical protein